MGRILFQLLAAACLSLLASCDPTAGVTITTPAPGANITSLSSIAGDYVGVKEAEVSQVTVSLVRYSDGKAWNGSAWGGSGSLSASFNTTTRTWACTATLPAGLDLPVDYYSITADALYNNGEKARATSVVSVGVSSAPVTPTPYGWGTNEEGQLGVGGTAVAAAPVQVPMRGALEGKIVVATSLGWKHSLALTADGKVYAWGSGLLGAGGVSEDSLPVAVSTSAPSALAGKKIIGVSAGDGFSLAVDDAGQAYSWGYNTFGELGTGSEDVDQPLPVAVGGVLAGKQVVLVEAGSTMSLAVTRQGEVFAWGNNHFGQLGNGTNTRSAVPVAVTTGLAGKRVTAIASKSGSHVLALTDAGEVYAWGSGEKGQLGNGGTADSNVPVRAGGTLLGKTVTAIGLGAAHSLAVAGGKVYSWGWTGNGQLGLGGSAADANALSPTEVGGLLTGKKVVSVHGGSEFSLAVTEDSKAFSWGRNNDSQLLNPSAGSRVPAECNLSNALSGGRVVLGVSTSLSSGLVLTGFKPLTAPQIVVEPYLNGVYTRIENGGTLDFGTDVVGAFNQIVIRVGNEGTSNISDMSVTTDGTHEFQFFGYAQDTPVAPGGTGSVIAYYTPNAVGNHTANMHIRSNGATFDIVLKGSAYRGGVLDSTFATPALTSTVRTTAVQLDDKVLIGGEFTTVGGSPRSYLARLLPNGTLDTSFTIGTNDVVSSIAIQPDGKILIGGSFNLVGGVARNRIARLNTDGTLDTTFDPSAGTGEILGIALQRNGKIIIVGSFSDVGGSGKSRVARLNTDGTVDTGFTATVSHAVQCVALQDDNKIVIGGSFTTVGGASHLGLARLDIDGSVDATYNPQINDGEVRCLVFDANDRAIIGGSFTTVNSTTRQRLARLAEDGTLETESYLEFIVEMNGPVNTMAVQAEGGLYIGGSFTTVQGQPRNNIARLDRFSDVVDFYVNPNINGAVSSLGLQKDGKLLVAGAFTQVGVQTSVRLARLTNEAAVSRITVTSPTSLEWEHLGGGPDLRQISFDVSADGGSTWAPLGTVMRNWYGSSIIAGLDPLPFPGQIRMRGYAAGGFNGGSSTMIEKIVSYGGQPQMSITSDGGFVYPGGFGSTQDFGVVATGSGWRTVTFNIQNSGSGELRNLHTSVIAGPAAASFRITQPAAPSVPAGGSTSVVVSFAPRTQGPVTTSPPTVLKIFSNDPVQPQLQITLTGIGGVDTANWKIQNNQVGVADDADTDGDGISTLMENALGANPNSASGVGISLSPPGAGGGGSGFAPPPGGGPTFTFNYSRNKLALGDLIFQVEWSDTLGSSDWHSTDVTEEILSDNGQLQQVQATIPAGTGNRRFARLKVTRP